MTSSKQVRHPRQRTDLNLKTPKMRLSSHLNSGARHDARHDGEPPNLNSEEIKVLRDADAMDVDSSDVSLISLVTTESSCEDIVNRLRPYVLEVKTFADSASLCADLNKLEFLKLQPMIYSEPINNVLNELTALYLKLRRREAANIPTVGEDIETELCEAAIEIRNMILYAELQNIEEDSGMKTYKGFVPDLQNPGQLIRVIIRAEDQKLWDRSIQLSLDDHPVCCVGTPGIGKTTTTLYLLQELVVNQKAPVVYTIRRSAGSRDFFFEFVPIIKNETVQDITVTVYGVFAYDKKSKIPSMQKGGAFYVVDPGEFKGSCDDTDQFYKAKFIMAASNDSQHWGGSEFTKFRGPSSIVRRLNVSRVLKAGVFIYGNLWTERQLIVAKPYIGPLRSIDDNEIMRRFRIVGGSLRDILEFNEETFTERVETALNIDSQTAQELAEGRCKFAFDSYSPSCLLIAISPYNQALDRFKIALKSDYVEECLASKYLRISWYEGLDDKDNKDNRGNLFESYLRWAFSRETITFPAGAVRESVRERPEVGNKNAKKNYQACSEAMSIGSKRTARRVPNMIESVYTDQTQKSMYYSKNESEPLVDMIFRVDGGYDAIQSTISEKHDDEALKMRQLKADLNLKDAEVLRIFYAVPWSRYSKFETKPVNPLLEQPDLHNVFIYHVGISAHD